MAKLKWVIVSLTLLLNSNLSAQNGITPADLHKQLLSIDQDSSKARIYLEIASMYKFSYPDSLKFYAEEALKISEAKKLDKLEAQSRFRLGQYYGMRGMYSESYDYLSNALKTFEKYNMEVYMMKVLNNIGIIFLEIGDYEDATDRLERSHELAHKLQDSIMIAKTLTNMGNISYTFNYFKEAKGYYDEALGLARLMNDNNVLANTHNNIGNVYRAVTEYDKAIASYKTAIKYDKANGDLYGMALRFNNIGVIYLDMDEHTKAEMFFKKALALRDSIGDIKGVIVSHTDLALLYFYDEDYEKAYSFGHKGYELATEYNVLSSRYRASEILFRILDKSDWYKEALEYARTYRILGDSILTTSNVENAMRLAMQHRFDKIQRDAEIEHHVKLQRSKFLAYSGIAVSAVSLIFLLIIIRLYIRKRRDHDLLDAKNKEIELKNTELSQQHAFKEDTTHMLIHDLKAPLNAILGFTKMEPKSEYSEVITAAGNNMLNIVTNVLDIYKLENTEVNLDFEPTNIKALSNDALMQLSFLIKQNSINLVNNINDAIQLHCDQDLIRRVLINLINNSIKYSPKGSIDINAEPNGDTVKISVTDTGSGIPKEILGQVFDKHMHTNVRTTGYHSSGLGLTFCKMAVLAHKGDIEIESKEGEGTTVSFNLPIKQI